MTVLERNRIEQGKTVEEKFADMAVGASAMRDGRYAQIGDAPMFEPKNERRNLQFMQKYYHRGSYFLDGGEWDVRKGEAEGKWDFLAPTGEDKDIDKSKLPAVMQVHNFGRMSRSKYTHLSDQDTTDRSEEGWWHAKRDNLEKDYVGRLGGMKDDFKDTKTAPVSTFTRPRTAVGITAPKQQKKE